MIGDGGGSEPSLLDAEGDGAGGGVKGSGYDGFGGGDAVEVVGVVVDVDVGGSEGVAVAVGGRRGDMAGLTRARDE